MRPVVPLTTIFVFFVVMPWGTVAQAQVTETISEIRIHGNHTTPDTDVLALSGLVTGDVPTDARLQQAEQLLRASGRFAGVELRRRYASIDTPSAVLIMIVVDEHAAVSEDDLTPGPAKRLRSAGMWLPILNHADGYGFTYGARVSFVDVLGDRSRISVPMSWGGERRVAVEVERSFEGPIPLLRGTLSLNRRVNPHFNVPDRRQEARIEAERPLTTWLRVGTGARVTQVSFGEYDARHTAAGLHATLDTRIDPSFPRNAVHARMGWERLWFGAGAPNPELQIPSSRAGRWRTDIRGYIGLLGASVLALRGQLVTSDTPLPFAEQVLLGGSDSLRGYRTGHRAGDNLTALSAEVRIPVNSPLSIGRFGVKGFVDTGTTWASGGRLGDQRFERGLGGGIYFGATAIIADLDVAWPQEGKPRAHFGLGVSF